MRISSSRKIAGFDGLHHQHALQNAAIDQRNAEKRLIVVLTGFAEILEAGMILGVLHGHRTHLLRHQAGETFVNGHAQGANALRAQPHGRGQHQIGAVGLQQIGRADIGLESFGDQRDDIHQGLGGFAALGCQIADLLQGQDIAVIVRGSRLAHVLNSLVVGGQFGINAPQARTSSV